LTPPESAASLLATPRRRKLLDAIWQHTSLSRAQFALLYQTPLERYAEPAQRFPLPRTITMLIRVGCSITGWKLSFAPSNCASRASCPSAQSRKNRRHSPKLEQLLDGLRYLLKEELRLNQPQASDGWLTQDALWLVSKTVLDRLRAHLLSQGIEGYSGKQRDALRSVAGSWPPAGDAGRQDHLEGNSDERCGLEQCLHVSQGVARTDLGSQ
jgi:hypothetical protein